MPVEEGQLCREDSSGSKQCVFSNSNRTANWTVVSGEEVDFSCVTTDCVKPPAVFVWAVGDRRLFFGPGDNDQCPQSDLQKSTGSLVFRPAPSHHGWTLSCNASNGNSRGGWAEAGFRLHVNGEHNC